MIHALLIPLVLAGSVPEPPVDPALEVLIVEASFDDGVCAPMAQLIEEFVDIGLDRDDATDMLVAYGVEIYEEGYGQNLTEEGEDALDGLMRDCIL